MWGLVFLSLFGVGNALGPAEFTLSTSGHINMKVPGGTPADLCTSNAFLGCQRDGSAGDWLWPAIWMLPTNNAYRSWPASGEIDILESRGNLNYRDVSGVSQGRDSMGSTLHFGPTYPYDPYQKAHGEKRLTSGTFSDSFHKFAVEWDESMIRFTIDGEEILKTVPPQGGFWELGEFDKNQPGMENPWQGATRMAPFDQEGLYINI